MVNNLRPDWAYDGAEVYRVSSRWNGDDDVSPRTVLRATATQLIVSDQYGNEERYRLKDRTPVGATDHRTTIQAPDAPNVRSALRSAAVSRAMSDLRGVYHQLQRGAEIMNNDLDAALVNTIMIRDAATRALEEMRKIQ